MKATGIKAFTLLVICFCISASMSFAVMQSSGKLVSISEDKVIITYGGKDLHEFVINKATKITDHNNRPTSLKNFKKGDSVIVVRGDEDNVAISVAKGAFSAKIAPKGNLSINH